MKKVKTVGWVVGKRAIKLISYNVPAGVGQPVFDKLDAIITRKLFEIGGVCGVEFGLGWAVKDMRGSEVNDPIGIRDGKVTTITNKCGGILGGISTGREIVSKVTFLRPVTRMDVKLAELKQTKAIGGLMCSRSLEG